ncbi:MAG: hypothetical protein IKL51_06960 [Lachnospiraceae bacterium]|nr:hypothetical protein [Lachnospiraceae bacterium]
MWNKIRWYLQKFMMGRNGRDELQTAALWLAVIFMLLSPPITRIIKIPLMDILSSLALLYSIFRFCSKEVYKRREENQKFIQELEFFKLRLSVRKTHKIYRCKGCGRKIRVPRGKGKIEITCPLCGRKFIRRT